jgi:hypothetical protein
MSTKHIPPPLGIVVTWTRGGITSSVTFATAIQANEFTYELRALGLQWRVFWRM